MKATRSAIFAGFNLIEVMMATTILLAGFVGLIQAVTIGSESLDAARKQQIAAQIIAAEVEKLRGGPWSRIAALPAAGTVTIDAAGAISGDTTSFALSNYTAVADDDNTALASLARDPLAAPRRVCADQCPQPREVLGSEQSALETLRGLHAAKRMPKKPRVVQLENEINSFPRFFSGETLSLYPTKSAQCTLAKAAHLVGAPAARTAVFKSL